MQAVLKYSLLFFCLAGAQARAQDAVALTHYVFATFTNGKVLQKNGSTDAANLNYNVLSKEMIFEASPGQYMALADPEKMDTVFIQDRKFVPVGSNGFYELLTGTPYPLLLEYTCTIREPGSDIGYGMSSVTTASPAVKSLIQSGGAYSLKLPDGFQVVTSASFWILKDGKYQKANNAKQWMALFPGKKEVISGWVRKANTNFSKKQDLVDLMKQLQ